MINLGVQKPDPKLQKTDPELYNKQKEAHNNFMKKPASERENLYRQEYTKNYITNQINEMAERGVPGAASYRNDQLARGIAQGALTRISQLQELENQQGIDTGAPPYNADEDIEKAKEQARERITSLGLNPEDYGI
jgi:hypothetical protein